MIDMTLNRSPSCISSAFLGARESEPATPSQDASTASEPVEEDPYVTSLSAILRLNGFESERYPNRLAEFLEANRVALPATAKDYSGTLERLGITNTMVLVMTGRCGSTWLASALKATGVVGEPEEYFADDKLVHYWEFDTPQTFDDVFEGVVNRYRCGGNFNFKINPTRLFWLARMVDLHRTFASNTVWVDMRRLNMVKQAFSFARAMVTGVWHRRHGDPIQTALEPTYEELEPVVFECIAEISRQERNIEDLYKALGVSPLRLFYEDLLDSKRQVLIQVLTRIDPTLDAFALSSSEGNTRRLAKDDDPMELEFVRRHAARINKLRAHRSQMSDAELYASLYA